MKTYTAHLKRDRDPVLLREGWSWAGLLFGPIWLLSQRAWIPALLEMAGLALLFAATPHQVWPACILGLALLTASLGRDFVRWSLERRGYALGHVVIAADRDAALLRLFAARPDLLDPAR